MGIAGALIASSLVVAGQPATAATGRLVSATALHTYATRADVDAALTADKFDPGTDRYGVRTYRLVPQPLRAAERWITQQRAVWERRLDQLDDYLLKLRKDMK